jgi:hypothetical protein
MTKLSSAYSEHHLHTHTLRVPGTSEQNTLRLVPCLGGFQRLNISLPGPARFGSKCLCHTKILHNSLSIATVQFALHRRQPSVRRRTQ